MTIVLVLLQRLSSLGAPAGLKDRSSRPTPPAVVAQVEALRRQRWTSKQIAAQVGVSPATVSRILRRLGLDRIQALEPAKPVRRYEREHPGELLHIEIKKLGRRRHQAPIIRICEANRKRVRILEGFPFGLNASLAAEPRGVSTTTLIKSFDVIAGNTR